MMRNNDLHVTKHQEISCSSRKSTSPVAYNADVLLEKNESLTNIGQVELSHGSIRSVHHIDARCRDFDHLLDRTW